MSTVGCFQHAQTIADDEVVSVFVGEVTVRSVGMNAVTVAEVILSVYSNALCV